MRPLLSVTDLEVSFHTEAGIARAVRGLSFAVEPGEAVAVVGESGSGKTVTALAILGLLEGAEVRGEVRFENVELLSAPEREKRRIRGAGIGLVLQDPMSSLNPVLPIGKQLIEGLTIRGISKRVAQERALEAMGRLGLPASREVLRLFPHQLSGGQQQRVALAGAVILNPRLLIADEPATALDVRTQVRMLDLLRGLATERGMAVILITHDLGIVAGYADSVVVMYAGRMMESGTTDDLFYDSEHPYSWALQGATPDLAHRPRSELPAIPGYPPSPLAPPPGCPFHERCAFAQDMCHEEEPQLRMVPGTSLRASCHFVGQLQRPAHLPVQPEVE